MTGPVCLVWKLMSLIGLLTATEKQVHVGRLPIQWHLKNNWRVPESLDKQIPVPKFLHPHLRWWLEEDNVLQGQPLHPLKHALQIFTDASKEGWGAHLNEHIARGTWSLPESHVHIAVNYLELTAVFLALIQFQDLCLNKIVLIATDTITMTWCIRKQVTLKARHIPGWLNVIDKLSRLGQTIQTEWSLHPEFFKAICSRWHQLQVASICLTGPRPPSLGSGLSLSWEDPDPYAFPPVAILGKVVEKLQDYPL